MKFELYEDALIDSPAQLAEWVSEWISELAPRQVILFEADLGMGKTTLTQKLVQKLGGEVVPSPTYSVINVHPTPSRIIHHLDLYRIETAEELESTGFWDLFSEPKGLIVIEWSERLNLDELPRSWKYIKISIQKYNEKFRKFSLFKTS